MAKRDAVQCFPGAPHLWLLDGPAAGYPACCEVFQQHIWLSRGVLLQQERLHPWRLAALEALKLANMGRIPGRVLLAGWSMWCTLPGECRAPRLDCALLAATRALMAR